MIHTNLWRSISVSIRYSLRTAFGNVPPVFAHLSKNQKYQFAFSKVHSFKKLFKEYRFTPSECAETTQIMAKFNWQ